MGYFQRIPSRKADGDFTRVSISVYELAGQNVDARSESHILRGAYIDTFSFLVVEQLFEQMNHTWTEYQNIAGKVAQLWQKGEDLVKQTKLGVGFIIDQFGNKVTHADIGNFRKADSPLVYDGSDRRKLNLTTLLVSQDDPKEIMDVIKALRSYGTAKIGAEGLVDGSLERIKSPYIFELTTQPNPFFHIKNACLNMMQTTYKPPFMKGLPTQIDMVMEFEDLQPLYNNSFNRGQTVIVTQDGQVFRGDNDAD